MGNDLDEMVVHELARMLEPEHMEQNMRITSLLERYLGKYDKRIEDSDFIPEDFMTFSDELRESILEEALANGILIEETQGYIHSRDDCFEASHR